MKHTYELKSIDTIISPSLIYCEEIIRGDIKKAIRTAGSPERLWPHVRSHKFEDIVRMQMEYGIIRPETATMAEVEMVAGAGAEEVIPAYPLVGPNMERSTKLAEAYPDTVFYGVEDDLVQFGALSGVCVEHNAVLPTLMDMNTGMSRTGIPIEQLGELYHSAFSLSGLHLCGMYCYDGNHNNKDAVVRQAQVDDTDKKASGIMEHLNGGGICCELAVTGGTPPFPCHTGTTRRYLSPGTAFIIDVGYYTSLPDSDFIPGVAVVTGIISHPARDVPTVDLGYGATASDPTGQQGYIVGLEGAAPIIHGEEYQAFRLEDESRILAVGSYLYVIPTHICPTTALYPEILVIKEGQVVDRWQMTARNRRITC